MVAEGGGNLLARKIHAMPECVIVEIGTQMKLHEKEKRSPLPHLAKLL